MATAQRNSDAVAVTMFGVVDSIVRKDEETGWAMMRLKVDKDFAHYTCVGKSTGACMIKGDLAKIGIGERLEIHGTILNHPRWGQSVQVEKFVISEPKTINEIAKYLSTNVKLIGPMLAKKIVDAFGENTFHVIDNEPKQLLDLDLIGEKRLAEVLEIWNEQRNYRKLLVFATSIGLSSNMLSKIWKKYKERAVELIKADPYRLARDIWGVGFKKADEVAKHLGIHELSDVRMVAALEHVVSEKAEKLGDCFAYAQELVNETAEMLAMPAYITPVTLKDNLLGAVRSGKLIAEQNRIYLPPMYHAEVRVAQRMKAMLSFPMPPQLQGDSLGAVVHYAKNTVKFPLDPKQEQAIARTLGSKLSVITGGPGTGKTTITQCVVRGFMQAGLQITLMAPTGRAAKRMAEVMGIDASTVHRFIWSKRARLKDGVRIEDIRVSSGVVFMDEASMTDIKLMDDLIDLLTDQVILVIIGDKDQLPSVGPGAVLRDLIECSVVPVSVLQHIFRQAKGSHISLAAAAINAGQMPDLKYFGRNHGIPDSDFLTTIIDDAEKQAEAVLFCATRMAEKHFGFDPIRDCQVLSPMHSGANGVGNLNAVLQRKLNPNPPAWVDRGGGIRWGVGDKVMQTKNEKELDISNGDVGYIVEIHKEDERLRRMVVNYDGRDVAYDSGDLWCHVQLAYATTIHKVQGSECPMIIMVLGMNHYPMLQRTLLYTGLTRGKKQAILIAHPRALSMAISNNNTARRNTWLAERLRA